jgi:hypothetical protein
MGKFTVLLPPHRTTNTADKSATSIAKYTAGAIIALTVSLCAACRTSPFEKFISLLRDLKVARGNPEKSPCV